MNKEFTKEQKAEVFEHLIQRGCLLDRFSHRWKGSRLGEVVESMSESNREILRSLTAEDIYYLGQFLMYCLAETDKGVESIKKFLNKETPRVGRFRQQLTLKEVEELKLLRSKE